MYRLINRLRRDDEGAALAEYGLLIALIALVCVVAITTLGTQVSAAFNAIATDIANGLASA